MNVESKKDKETEDYVVDIELRARARKSAHTPPKYETRGKFTSKKLEVMIEKLNYKKYLNYPDDDTELVESTSVETIDKESEKDQDEDFVVAREYDQNEQISDDQELLVPILLRSPCIV